MLFTMVNNMVWHRTRQHLLSFLTVVIKVWFVNSKGQFAVLIFAGSLESAYSLNWGA